VTSPSRVEAVGELLASIAPYPHTVEQMYNICDTNKKNNVTQFYCREENKKGMQCIPLVSFGATMHLTNL